MYYDMQHSTLRMARATAVAPKLQSQWVRTTVFNSTDANAKKSGQHVSMKFDSSGNIHASCFNANGKLIYIYGKKNSSGTWDFADSVVVDTNGGQWTDITVKNNLPYIAYQSSTTGTSDGVRYAYVYDSTEKNTGDAYTDWEYEVLPALDDHVPTAERISLEMSTGSATWGEAAVGFRSDRFELMYKQGE